MAALPDANALQGLFSALLKAGVVSSDASSSTSTPNSGVQLARLEDIKPQEEVDQSRLAAREYRRRLLAHPINLNANDITRYVLTAAYPEVEVHSVLRQRPVIVEMQYERQRLQCNQCGLRFIDNVAGKKDLEDHLDVHFKQNRKAAQNAGRGHGRSWFIGIEVGCFVMSLVVLLIPSVQDWIHDTADVKGKGRADGGRRLTVKEAAAEEVAKRDAELRAMHVVITDGDETKPIKCLICKEPIVPQFLEDVEEWVWQNAIKKDDKVRVSSFYGSLRFLINCAQVFHATCHAEAMSSTNSLVSRIRNEATGSRSTTPSSLRATPPKTIGSPSAAGTKRKADGDVKHEEGTPPSKKVALAA
jgi:pre-mRNA cleavage complex 2 protein Pcf11